MQIRWNEAVQTLAKPFENADQLIEWIQTESAHRKNIPLGIKINSEEVSGNVLEAIQEMFQQIQTMDVKALSANEFFGESVHGMNEYLSRICPQLKQLGDQFYMNPDENTWKLLQELLEGIQWILAWQQNVEMYVSEMVQLEPVLKLQRDLADLMIKMLDALENKDQTLVGDLINYELEALFSDYLKENN